MKLFNSKNKKDYFGKRVKVIKKMCADDDYVGKTGTITGNCPNTWQFNVRFDLIYKDELNKAYGLNLLFPLNCLEII